MIRFQSIFKKNLKIEFFEMLQYVTPCHAKPCFYENYSCHTLPRLITAKKLKKKKRLYKT